MEAKGGQMSEYEELREKIAERIADSRCEVCNNCGASISTDDPGEVADEILSIIADKCYFKVLDWKPSIGTVWQPVKEIKKDG